MEPQPLSLRYLIIEETYPVLWAMPYLSHKNMAELVNMKVTSAGTVKVMDGCIHCGGGSYTLGMETGKRDEEIISAYLGVRKEN